MNTKLAIEAAKKFIDIVKKLLDDKNNNNKKSPIIVLAVIISILFIVPAAAISIPGILFKGILSSGSDSNEINNYDLEDSAIYQDIKEVYLQYNDEMEQSVEDEVSSLEEEYTYTYNYNRRVARTDSHGLVMYDNDGNIIYDTEPTSETIEPTIVKDIQITKPEIQIVLAYISTKYTDIQTDYDTYTFDADEIKEFLKNITRTTQNTVVERDIEDGEPKQVKLIVYTYIEQPLDIASMYFPDEDKQDQFYVCYESFLDIQDAEVIESYNNIDLSSFTIYGNGLDIPHYLQYDSRWWDYPYGTSNVKSCGCGPTSTAMVFSYLMDRAVLPTEIVDWTRTQTQSYYVAGIGANWSLFPDVSQAYGINCSQISVSASALISALSSGKPIIASMRPGTFTRGGHFIVLRGITNEGKILVNDPNDNDYEKRFFEREFAIQLILNESKAFWAFERR